MKSLSFGSLQFDVDCRYPRQSICMAVRTAKRCLVLSIRTERKGFEIPMHVDANYPSDKSIRSFWWMMKRPYLGGELVVDGPVRGGSRFKMFDGRTRHGVTLVEQGIRTVLLIQHFHKV